MAALVVGGWEDVAFKVEEERVAMAVDADRGDRIALPDNHHKQQHHPEGEVLLPGGAPFRNF